MKEGSGKRGKGEKVKRKTVNSFGVCSNNIFPLPLFATFPFPLLPIHFAPFTLLIRFPDSRTFFRSNRGRRPSVFFEPTRDYLDTSGRSYESRSRNSLAASIPAPSLSWSDRSRTGDHGPGGLQRT